MNNFSLMYPRCAALGLIVIHDGPGYDELDVEKKLGPDRFAHLMHSVESVFCCNHAKYSTTVAGTHRVAGYEVHCVYAADLEKFLESEGK